MQEEKQTLEITVEFQVKHNPGTEEHLIHILESYLKGKGVQLEGNKIIV